MKIIDADPLADLRAQPRSLVVPKLEVCNWHRGRPRKRSSKAFGLAARVGGPKVKLAWPTNWQPMKTSESAHYWTMKNFSHAKQIPMTLTLSRYLERCKSNNWNEPNWLYEGGGIKRGKYAEKVCNHTPTQPKNSDQFSYWRLRLEGLSRT